MSIENSRIQLRRGTAEVLTTVNEVLLAGEVVLETDTGKFKFVDGVTAWNDLEYVGGGQSESLSHETWIMTLDD